MNYIRFFEDLTKNDVAIAGGKGASLGEMLRSGISVPPGFVVLSAAFDQFITRTNLNVEIDAALDEVNLQEVHTIEFAAEKIRALILEKEIPSDIETEIIKSFKQLNAIFVAVRSSATAEDSSLAAWAGQLESYLNTTEKELLKNVQRCWASLFTPRAIFYRFEQKMHHKKISVAVVVQKMVESEAAGIAFSVHPVTQDPNQIIIEAGWGLGEAIVSGQVTPDSYVIHKSDNKIVKIDVNEKNKALYQKANGGNEWKILSETERKRKVLSDPEITALAGIIIKIEAHYGFPVDVEWAYAKGKFYIVQSRPITTLMPTEIETPTEAEIIPKLHKVDWYKFIEREIDLFIFSSAFEANGFLMKRELGFGYNLMLVQYSGTKGTLFHSKNEMNASEKYFETLLKNKDPQINKWIKIEKQLQNKPVPSEPLKLLGYFQKVVVYSTLLPTRMLFSIEKNPSLKHWKQLFEEMRGRGTYPQLYQEKIKPLLRKMLETENIPSELSRYVTLSELRNFIANGTVVSQELLEKRRKGYVLYMLKKEIGIIYEQFSIESVNSNNVNLEVKGTIACKGIAKGIVKIVNTINDMKKFNSGEILVSISTNPSLMPVIKKAAAIVTDEGGIISHAAIISREMNRPCIIGTGNATCILKDGDLVEVDANKGVVKVIKSITNEKLENPQNQPIEMIKKYSRENSLIYAYIWDIDDRKFCKELYLSNIKNLVFVKQGGSNKIAVYYDDLELSTDWEKLAKEVQRNPAHYDFIKTRYDTHLKYLQPYLEQKKTITNLKEFKDYYEHWVKWWLPLEILGEFADFDNSEEMKKKATNFREKSQIFSDEIDNVYLKFFSKAYPQYKKYVYVLLPEEVFSLQQKAFSQNQITEFEKRLGGYALVNSKLVLLNELNAELQKNNIILHEPCAKINNCEVKGLCGNKGKVKGKVHLIRHKEDLLKVKEGEIIVTEMTSPDYVSTLKKAAAIITDEGGITCHAAIVAREMNKPCVIGTKVATQVLKDGDVVQVDAERGKVSICHAAIAARKLNKPCIIGTKVATQILQDGDMVEVDADKGTVVVINKSVPQEYRKMMNRSFPLIFFECWYKGERWGLPKISGNSMFFEPMFVYHQNHGTDVLYNFTDVKQSPDLLIAYFTKRADRLKSLTENQLKYYHALTKLSKSKRTLSMASFKKVFSLSRKMLPILTTIEIIGNYSKEITEIVEMSKQTRTSTEDMVFKSIDLLLKNAAKLLPKEYQPYLYFLTYTEIVGKLPPIETLKQREVQYIYYQDTVYASPDEKEFAQKHNLKIIESKINNSNDNIILSGKSIYPGKVTGKAHVVFGIEDMKKLQKGEILVTSMTTPDLIALGRAFSAIVTDEGGMLCHAAIISRELRVPCIVGTKHATQILKSGDLIEVDADAGTVKIINNIQNQNKKLILVKEHSREYSLPQVVAYSEVVKRVAQDINYQLENELFRYNRIVDVYHDPKELKRLFAAIAALAQDKKKIDLALTNFTAALTAITPYLNKKKFVTSVKEFKRLYGLLIEFWAGICYVWIIPGLENLPQEVRDQAMKLRTQTEKYSSLRDKVLVTNLKRMHPELGELVKFLLPEEIFNYKYSPELVKALQERSKGYVFFQEQLYSGESMKTFMQQQRVELIDAALKPEAKEITGTIAFNGKVTGTARLVLIEEDLKKIKAGDVMISPMTRPEFLPAMKKAAAFVTDEGGITCHAAIVAREMKKPCIIGTKIATKVLIDGDMVEVDADKGIVRILSKQNVINNPPRNLTLYGTRDLTLGVLDIGMDAESLPLPHLKKAKLKRPYFVTVREENKDKLFMDLEQVEWQKREILKEVKKDRKYVQKVLDNAKRSSIPLMPLLNHPRPLSRKELTEFIGRLSKAWSEYAGVWWTIEALADKKEYAALVEKTMAFRKATDKFVPGADAIIRETIKKLYPRLKKYAEVLLINEVINNQIPTEKELTGRLRKCLLADKTIYLGESIDRFLIAKNILLVEPQTEDKEVHELFGQAAYGGKYEGIVSKVFTKDDANKFVKGNVLVASSSTPDLLPAILKAGAIVADEGGITSHAAITSRELKKPCIIGTKYATKILNDGDLVEVDADNGVIKILKRKLQPVPEESKSSFELEFTRETPISMYYVWLNGYLEACKTLKMGLTKPRKTYATYKNGVIQAYTQKDNIKIMKEHINKISNAKLLNIIERYLSDYDAFLKNKKLSQNKKFLTQLVSGFIITFILGDMEHQLQKKAISARTKTEKLFSLIEKALAKEAPQMHDCLLTLDGPQKLKK